MAGNIDLASALGDANARYLTANPRSSARHKAAARGLPGGNTRAVLFYEPFPIAMVRGEDCRLWDLDGHVYTDFVSEYGAGLYGHSDPTIRATLIATLESGWALGAPNVHEAELANALVDRFPAFERVRFCNSGTEANLLAMVTARAVTRRPKVLVFNEGYHGGIITFAHGGSELNAPFDFVMADYNDINGVVATVRAQAKELAAVIVEPMLGGGGCIPATKPFLLALQDVCAETKTLLIFDEVITSRLGPQGLHGALGLKPDLVTMGKYLGGGCSFGVFGGRADIMDRFDPASENAFGHGGTFNNNVLSMSAGLAGLTKVLTPEAVTAMNERGDGLRQRLNERIAKHRVDATVIGCGSVMNFHFKPGPIDTPSQLEGQDKRLHKLFQIEMILRGQYVTPRGMLATSLPIGAREIDGFVDAFDDFLATHRSILPSGARSGTVA